MARQLLQMAAELESDIDEGQSDALMFFAGDGDEDSDEGPLADFAESLYRHRRRRGRYLPEKIFAEPAWDILLDLYVNGVRGRPVSITSACIAGDIPATTGLRWLGVLEQESLIEREVSRTDARVTLVRLTASARQRLRDFFAEASRTTVIHPEVVAGEELP
ncbi:MAG TPA: MarR family transcriptional regulator [Sphingomicrobium sp.]